MPWSVEQKNKTHERILESAVKLFSACGFDNVTIGDVMNDAQLTHGAFYSHFGSKKELYTEAITAATKNSLLTKAQEKNAFDKLDLLELLTVYLNIDHVQQKTHPCPLAFLAADVASREDEVRIAYTNIYHNLITILDKKLEHLPFRKNRAFAISALMIGGVVISRALHDDDTILALLNACREYGEELIRNCSAETE
jgi:TetR/AcrR family transcriptional repressor of nem operon